MGSIPLAQ
jgi:hypothetical protein